MALFALMSGNIMLLFIAFCVFVGAGQESTMHQTQSLMEGQLARAAMLRDFRTLPACATLRAAGQMLLCTSQQDFPIVTGETAFGLLSREELLAGLLRLGPETYVTEVMDREFCWASPEDRLDGMASTLTAGRCSSVLVLQEDELVGMVTRDNLIGYTVLRRVAREWSLRRPGASDD